MLSNGIWCVHEYVSDANVSNQKLCNVCGMAQFLTSIYGDPVWTPLNTNYLTSQFNIIPHFDGVKLFFHSVSIVIKQTHSQYNFTVFAAM